MPLMADLAQSCNASPSDDRRCFRVSGLCLFDEWGSRSAAGGLSADKTMIVCREKRVCNVPDKQASKHRGIGSPRPVKSQKLISERGPIRREPSESG